MLLARERELIARVLEGCKGENRHERLWSFRQLLNAAGLRSGRLARVLELHAQFVTHALRSPPVEAAVKAARAELALFCTKRSGFMAAKREAFRTKFAARLAAAKDRYARNFKPEA